MFVSKGCISAYVLKICLYAYSLLFRAAPYRALLLRGVNCGAQSYEMKFGIAGYCFALPDSVW